MASKQEDKRRILIALIVCSTAAMLRSCNGKVVEEEKTGFIVEPPQIEEIKHEAIYEPATEEIINDIYDKKIGR